MKMLKMIGRAKIFFRGRKLVLELTKGGEK